MSDPRPAAPLPPDASDAGESASPIAASFAFPSRLRWTLRTMNLYPPFLGAGVRVRRVPGRLAMDVSMGLHWWNRNYVGTHFGGSLYTMCDPFYMLLLMWGLGRDYIVWDKAAEIQFRRPGRGTVHARFAVTQERLDEIRRGVDEHGKVEPRFAVQVRGEDGELVAQVDKLLFVRRK